MPTATVFEDKKVVQENRTESLWPKGGLPLSGYEIHHGRTSICEVMGEPLAEGGVAVGWRSNNVVGTYLHGILNSDEWRCAFLNEVRLHRGFPAQDVQPSTLIEHRIQRWAEHVKTNLRPGVWTTIVRAIG